MHYPLTRVAMAVALSLGAAGAVSAQSVRGFLLEAETRQPIVAGTVALLDAQGKEVASAVTSESGAFLLEADVPGAYWLRGESLGYRSASGGPIELGNGMVVDVEFRLAVDAVLLEALSLVAAPRIENLERVGFYERKRMGIGWFLTRQDMEKKPHVSTSDALRGVPGVRLVPRGFGQNLLLLRGAARCGPQIIVDGVRLVDRGNVDVVLPQDIDGIEVYMGAAGPPIEFGGLEAGCGTILIWTREPGT